MVIAEAWIVLNFEFVGYQIDMLIYCFVLIKENCGRCVMNNYN